MFERFTGDARHIVVSAQERARELGHNYIGTEHLLLAILTAPPENVASQVLHRLGYLPETVRAGIERTVGRGSTTEPSGHIPFTPRCKKVLELSLREALRLRHDHIGSAHLLLGILGEGGGVAAQLLAETTSLDEIRTTVQAAISSAVSPGGAPARRTPAAERVLALAEALAAGAPLGSHHLLEAHVRADASMAGRALAGLGVDAAGVTAQVDSLDITETSDVTPEQVAAGRMRWRLDGDEAAALVTTDPETVARVRKLIEQTSNELTGEGPLAGPFIGLHRSLHTALDTLDAAFGSPDEPSSWRHSLRDRLTRRRRP